MSEQASWTSPAWRKEVKDWIEEALNERVLTLDGPITQIHLRPWSTVLRVPNGGRDLYFKASTGALVHEAAVTQALHRWRPDCILPILKVEPRRGWTLMFDGGQRLREAFHNGLDIDRWEETLALYAGLQIELADHIDELLAVGLPDRRLTALPDLFAQLLADTDALLLNQPDGLTPAEHERLAAAGPYLAEQCRRLAEFKLPATIQHGDLHDGNIFLQDGRCYFFDWGDSSLAHPFFSLRSTFVSIENTFDLAEDDPYFDRLAHAYLEAWTAFGTLPDLTAAFALARQLWSLSSLFGWHSALSQAGPAGQKYAYAIPALLQEFLAANPGLD